MENVIALLQRAEAHLVEAHASLVDIDVDEAAETLKLCQSRFETLESLHQELEVVQKNLNVKKAKLLHGLANVALVANRDNAIGIVTIGTRGHLSCRKTDAPDFEEHRGYFIFDYNGVSITSLANNTGGRSSELFWDICNQIISFIRRCAEDLSKPAEINNDPQRLAAMAKEVLRLSSLF